MTTSEQMLVRYTLLGRLGWGGFATVDRAWDPQRGHQVALKALLPHLAEEPSIHERFLVEAWAIAPLRHPNIVVFYDVGEADGRPFFTMELVDGQTLAELLATGSGMPLEQVIEIVGALASAIDYLHGAGLVHRDIKANNIMRDASGRVVLMDFGIARALDQTLNTRTGVKLGTPEVMAPEQVRGDEVGPAADIYALGILAYQLLSGRPPFAGDTARVLHAQVYDAPPALPELRPDLPTGVWEAIQAALAKEPGRRPPTADAFAEALRRAAIPISTSEVTERIIAPTQPLGTLTAMRRLGGWRTILVAAMAVIAVLGGIGVALARGGGKAAPAPIATELSKSSTGSTAVATPRVPVISGLSVCDNIFDCKKTDFTPGQNIAACHAVTPGGDGVPLTALVMPGTQAPNGPNDAAAVARSTPIAQPASGPCYSMMVNQPPPPPSNYSVWVLAESGPLEHASFTTVPAPTPSPTPSPMPRPSLTPEPTAAPAPPPPPAPAPAPVAPVARPVVPAPAVPAPAPVRTVPLAPVAQPVPVQPPAPAPVAPAAPVPVQRSVPQQPAVVPAAPVEALAAPVQPAPVPRAIPQQPSAQTAIPRAIPRQQP
jgi:hypothetical protein